MGNSRLLASLVSGSAIPVTKDGISGLPGGGGAGSCVEQLLTGQTAALSPDQAVGQQFTSDSWFSLAQITKAQFSLKRASSVDSSAAARNLELSACFLAPLRASKPVPSSLSIPRRAEPAP